MIHIPFFCLNIVQVPPGEYHISALAATPESSSGVLFLPPHVHLVVKNPLLNVEFSQVTFLSPQKS